jgi:hypothetical protein
MKFSDKAGNLAYVFNISKLLPTCQINQKTVLQILIEAGFQKIYFTE